jgi:hypothetical protein
MENVPALRVNVQGEPTPCTTNPCMFSASKYDAAILGKLPINTTD